MGLLSGGKTPAVMHSSTHLDLRHMDPLCALTQQMNKTHLWSCLTHPPLKQTTQLRALSSRPSVSQPHPNTPTQRQQQNVNLPAVMWAAVHSAVITIFKGQKPEKLK